MKAVTIYLIITVISFVINCIITLRIMQKKPEKYRKALTQIAAVLACFIVSLLWPAVVFTGLFNAVKKGGKNGM